jgi:hypothetical protein
VRISAASVHNGVTYLEHEHDAAGPMSRFNVFFVRPGAPQFLAAFVDGPVDPSGRLNTSQRRSTTAASFASLAPRSCLSRSITVLPFIKISALHDLLVWANAARCAAPTFTGSEHAHLDRHNIDKNLPTTLCCG